MYILARQLNRDKRLKLTERKGDNANIRERESNEKKGRRGFEIIPQRTLRMWKPTFLFSLFFLLKVPVFIESLCSRLCDYVEITI